MDTKSTRSTLSTHSTSHAERFSELERASASVRVAHTPDLKKVGTQVQLSNEVLPIGRDPRDEGLRLEDAKLSRVHARITFDGRAAAYRIGDGQSRNGTFVNGQRIDTALLSSGDVIRVGDTLLVYGNADPMVEVRARALEAAPLPTSLLLRGEPGTGKEVMARLIHESSGLEGNFIPLDCASIPPNVFNADLPAYLERVIAGAALQGTHNGSPGKHHTLFLDEIGACPLALQQALLPALEQITQPAGPSAGSTGGPSGPTGDRSPALRIIASTHLNLEAAVAAGAFLANLYARLAELTLELPALRDRKDEIIPSAEESARTLGKPLNLSADAAEALLCWHWPFNLRELNALIVKCLTRKESTGRIGLKELEDARSDMVRPLLERRSAPRRSSEPDEALERSPRPSPTRNHAAAPEASPRYVFRQEGEIWTLVFDGKASRLKDIRGLHYIATLLRHPGVHFHVLELTSGPGASTLASPNEGPPLDETARSSYRRRLAELTDDLAVAENERDESAAARARQEIDALTEQLASMYGYRHGRRQLSAVSEKARVNVTRTIRLVVDKLAQENPGLAHYIRSNIHTGTMCSYAPDPARDVPWEL